MSTSTANPNPTSAIPTKAADVGPDLNEPLESLLVNLSLLGSKDERTNANGFISTFTGPPQSVAVLEAGATAISKWWAAGLGAAVAAFWATFSKWWNANASNSVHVAVILGAAFATGAAVIAIGYIVASDVRGRSNAASAAVDARARVAVAMIESVRALYQPAEPSSVEITPLPATLIARNTKAEGDAAENGWAVIAMREVAGKTSYLLAKNSKPEWVAEEDVKLSRS